MNSEIKKFNKFQNTLLLLVIIVALVSLTALFGFIGGDMPLELMLFLAVVVYSEYLLIKKSYLYSVLFANLGTIVFLAVAILNPVKCSGTILCMELLSLIVGVPFIAIPFLVGLLFDLRRNKNMEKIKEHK